MTFASIGMFTWYWRMQMLRKKIIFMHLVYITTLHHMQILHSKSNKNYVFSCIWRDRKHKSIENAFDRQKMSYFWQKKIPIFKGWIDFPNQHNYPTAATTQPQPLLLPPTTTNRGGTALVPQGLHAPEFLIPTPESYELGISFIYHPKSIGFTTFSLRKTPPRSFVIFFLSVFFCDWLDDFSIFLHG